MSIFRYIGCIRIIMLNVILYFICIPYLNVLYCVYACVTVNNPDDISVFFDLVGTKCNTIKPCLLTTSVGIIFWENVLLLVLTL